MLEQEISLEDAIKRDANAFGMDYLDYWTMIECNGTLQGYESMYRSEHEIEEETRVYKLH